MQQFRFIQVGVGNRGSQILQDFTTQYGSDFTGVQEYEAAS
jgi:hypothetical protein